MAKPLLHSRQNQVLSFSASQPSFAAQGRILHGAWCISNISGHLGECVGISPCASCIPRKLGAAASDECLSFSEHTLVQ